MKDISAKYIKKFIDIGFILDETSVKDKTLSKPCREYKYRPDYMPNSHYTLVIFNNRGFRLYIHSNKDGSFIKSIFDITLYISSDVQYLTNGLNKEFSKEIRQLKIKKLLK